MAAEVLAGRAQLGFVEGPDAPSGLHTRTVTVDEQVVVVPRGHPWSPRTVAAAELAATPAREVGSGTRTAFERALAATVPGGLTAPTLELSATTAVRGAVLAGAGPTG